MNLSPLVSPDWLVYQKRKKNCRRLSSAELDCDNITSFVVDYVNIASFAVGLNMFFDFVVTVVVSLLGV